MDAGRTYTNHPGIVEYKGRNYFFYHDSSLPGGNNFKRSVRVQEFRYGADGSIPKLPYNGQGPEGIARLNPFERVEAQGPAHAAAGRVAPAERALVLAVRPFRLAKQRRRERRRHTLLHTKSIRSV